MTNIFKNTAIATFLLTSAVFMGSATAQNSMPGMDMTAPRPPAASAVPAGMKQMGSMDTAAMMSVAAPALEKLSGKGFDRAFLSMMIPHHQAALDMARAVLPLSKDAKIKTWASSVIKAQQAEIGSMTALLKPLGGSEARMAAMMNDMLGMGQMVKSAKNPDQSFVQNMLPHHASAIDMAKIALQRSSDPRVLKLAWDIVVAQAREMYEYRTWLLSR